MHAQRSLLPFAPLFGVAITSAFLLAATGLLDGKRATTHWLAADVLAQRYPHIRVDPGVLYVDEGSILTSAGAAAALDLCLYMVRRDYGAAVAAEAARLCVMPLERSGGQWNKGKGCETFGPIGPWLVTKDEIKDPQNLDMLLTVNGETRQKGNTRTMIFGVEHLVWYCSQFFVMEPGDIIVTGTPPGVALGMKPEPKFLKAGDVVKLSIAGLGEQTQKIVALKR